MPTHDTLALLISHKVITPDLVERSQKVPALPGTSRVDRLIAAGANPAIRDKLAELTGIPVAPPALLTSAGAVHLLPATAKKLADAGACPIHRDPAGVLHVLITEPETFDAVDKVLTGFKVWLAPDATVRDLLRRLYGIGAADAAFDFADAIDIDLEASRRQAPAPSKPTSSSSLPSPDPLAPRSSGAFAKDPLAARPSGSFTSPDPLAARASGSFGAPSDPLAARASGSFGAPSDPLAARPSGSFRKNQREEETMRIPRARGTTSPGGPAQPPSPSLSPSSSSLPSPSPSSAAPAITAIPAPNAKVATDPALGVALPAANLALDAALRGAFRRGVLVGAAVTAVVAAVVAFVVATAMH